MNNSSTRQSFLLNAKIRHDWALENLSCYFGDKLDIIDELPLKRLESLDAGPLPPRLCTVALPDWANHCGVEGVILVPESLSRDSWDSVPWLDVAAWYMSSVAEREFEAERGPIFSNSFRLKGWDPRLWKYAWANRIALFLREWAGRKRGEVVDVLFGGKPQARLILSHDVDAISKTLPIRGKQTFRILAKALRRLGRLDIPGALNACFSALSFFFSSPSYDRFAEIIKMEKSLKAKSLFFVYPNDEDRRGLKKWILDPSYRLNSPVFSFLAERVKDHDAFVGSHPSIFHWRDTHSISRGRDRLEKRFERSISFCRQHWLKFSFADTWHCQREAGFHIDLTLGFNDRPGFRNGSALLLKPDPCEQFRTAPMVLMDSHLYDCRDYDQTERISEMRHWLQELNQVGGIASVIWHQRVFAPDYGWRDLYVKMLELANDLGIEFADPEQIALLRREH